MLDKKRLKKLRNQFNYSQNEIAERLGVSQQQYQRLESGQTEFPRETTLNKLAEILGTIYGQSLAQAIISGAKLGETQPEITVSEEDKLVKENKLAEQAIKTPQVIETSPKQQLLDSEFEIYSARKNGKDNIKLNDIMNVGTQGMKKIGKLNSFKTKIRNLLDDPTLEQNLNETKAKIQNLIDSVSGAGDGKLRISNGSNLKFGGDF